MQRFGVDSPDRVAAVHSSRLLAEGPEEAFDRIVRLASTVLATPMVALTVVDDVRSVLKGRPATGMFAQVEGTYERPVGEVACQVVVDTGDEVCATDVERDPRLRDLAQLRELGVRSWLGRPVRDPDGYVLGNLCAMDTVVREWSDTERESLHALALTASSEIALRRALRATEQHAALAAELAETLEQALVPARVPNPPGVEIGTSFRPGGTGVRVLGDFYDVIAGDGGDGGFGVVIGDVSGHGASAARTTAMARSSVRTACQVEHDPVAVLRIVNGALRAWFDGSTSFVTAAYARVHPPAAGTGRCREATVASCGHPPGFVLRAGGAVEQLAGGGTVLGLLPDAVVDHEVVRLGPGDSLVLHTDGITEARPAAGAAQFDEAGVVAALSALAGTGAERIAARVAEAAFTHAQDEIDDDAGVVVVRISTPGDRPVVSARRVPSAVPSRTGGAPWRR